MKKQDTIFSFFTKKDDEQTSKRHRASTSESVNFKAPQQSQSNTNEVNLNQVNQQENHGDSETPQLKSNAKDVDPNQLERDPAKRKPMWEHPVNLREQVRRAYLSLGPYKIQLTEYKNNGPKGHTLCWLKFQACALRGHDESSTSKNRGNLIGLIKLLTSYQDEVAKVILENSPYNAKYTSSDIQKEILSIIANKVRKHICSEVGDSFFCVMVDELRDESKKEKMAIVLRFVDAKGMIQERFLDSVHVTDTLSATLKTSYDGASNMRGEWNGLQALVRYECPYAYYVNCFAHRLQLALVCASREVIPTHKFFNKLVFTINVVCASSKHHDKLQKAKAEEIKTLLEMGEIKSGSGLNQVRTLRRAGDTRWGSHFNSVCSLIDMFGATRAVLQGIVEYLSHTTFSQRGDADTACDHLESFEFVFILHLMKEVLGKTETLSQPLQKKSQDILNAMELVSSTKANLNEFRNNGWETFLSKVIFFVSNLHVTFEHYYQVDLFTSTLDKQLEELNSRFDENAMELLTLSSSLVSKEIDVDKICLLVKKYYPEDFTE
ncbi:uncharacterized protein LOC143565408 [Bidens hawaiensis]|uniref:uncharacterized protein LOC143565408 n=1 Tax=Bidens hawaiensis TaxID=980011 RepID=UPI00404A194D